MTFQVKTSLTGLHETQKALWRLQDKETRPAIRSGINAGLVVLAKAIRQAIPSRFKKLKKAVGKRFKKISTGGGETEMVAMVGMGVAKKRAYLKTITSVAPHWVILGTQKRVRRTIGGKFSWLRRPSSRQRGTGQMRSYPIVKTAFSSAQSRAVKATIDGVHKYLLRKAGRLANKS